jgi:hypothetical protein
MLGLTGRRVPRGLRRIGLILGLATVGWAGSVQYFTRRTAELKVAYFLQADSALAAAYRLWLPSRPELPVLPEDIAEYLKSRETADLAILAKTGFVRPVSTTEVESLRAVMTKIWKEGGLGDISPDFFVKVNPVLANLELTRKIINSQKLIDEDAQRRGRDAQAALQQLQTAAKQQGEQEGGAIEEVGNTKQAQ